ncbi:MAG: hypothetical protein AB7U46_00280 [Paenirhodobacter sp.]|uniref:hypothetical protein n=1 Tax=Paenirhodobacter sp. TaxID=1965326 RepID=UPI003D098845
MPSTPSILIIGNSHIECLIAAAKTPGFENVGFVNLKQVNKREDASDSDVVSFVEANTPMKAPDVVCLCIKGNQHNIFGIVESPKPFSLGDAEVGAIPPLEGKRAFIPFGAMVENFEMLSSPSHIEAVFAAFPAARRLYLNAPPPISSWEHIVAHPELFSSRIHLGPAPKALRMQLYRAQTLALRNIAARCKATFVEPVAEALDQEGFLAERFYGLDPTHANAAYGAIMLKALTMEAQDMLAMGEAK